MDGEKLRAVKRYMEKKDADLTQSSATNSSVSTKNLSRPACGNNIDEGSEDASAPAKKQKEKIKQPTVTQQREVQ